MQLSLELPLLELVVVFLLEQPRLLLELLLVQRTLVRQMLMLLFLRQRAKMSLEPPVLLKLLLLFLPELLLASHLLSGLWLQMLELPLLLELWSLFLMELLLELLLERLLA